jgi:hypothetical protein
MYLRIDFHPGLTEHNRTLATVRLPARMHDNAPVPMVPLEIDPSWLSTDAVTRLLDAFTTWARDRNRHHAQTWNLGDEEEVREEAYAIVETINYVVAELDEGEEASGHFGYNDGFGPDRRYEGIAWEFLNDAGTPYIIGAEEA